MSQLQVTGEAKIRDIQGPVVANSGVITALDGAASQYVRGDGTLADFPTSSGGGSSVSYYLNSSVSQGTIGGVAYRELSKEPIIGAGTDIAISSNGYVASYLTDANDPDVILIPGGNFNCEFYFSVNNNTGNPFFYAELYKYDGTTFTLLGSSVGVPEYITQGTTIAPYYFAIPVATATLALTDRLAIRIYVNVGGRTVTLHTENGHLCQVVTTLSKGMVSLNNLTDQSQFLTTGTSGTNFNIVSSGDTHTFNIPNAGVADRGLITNLAQTIGGAKTFSSVLRTDGGFLLKDSTLGTVDGYTSIGGVVGSISIGYAISSTPYINDLEFAPATSNTFTFPNASGTIALTSNLSSYVPYTGATANVNLGGFGLSSSSLLVTFFSSFNANILLKKVGLGSTTPTYVSQFAASSGVGIGYSDGTGGGNFIFPTASINDYTFPAITGTLALLEGTQTFTGTKTFGSSVSINTGGQADLSIVSSAGNSSNINSFVAGVLKSTISTSATEFKLISAIDNILKFQSSTNFRASLIFSNSADYNYTFPASSGTIALTSNLSSYVPYSGATANVNLGIYGLLAQAIVVGQTSTQGYIHFKTGGSTALSADTSQAPYGTNGMIYSFDQTGGNYKQFVIDSSLLTNNTIRTYSMPNASGTLALTSNLSSYVPYTGATTNVNIGNNNYLGGSILLNQSAGSASATGYLSLSGSTGSGLGAIVIGLGSGTTSSMNFPTSSNYTYIFPATSGTLALTSNLSAYLPLTGGTLTGALSGTSATFSSRVTADNIYINATTAPALGSPKLFVKMASSNSYEGILLASSSNNNVIAIAHTGSIGLITTNYGTSGANTPLAFGTNGAEQMQISTTGSVGIGTTPPTTSTFPHLFSGRNFVTFSGSSNDVYIGSNFYYNGGFLARYSEPSIMINSSNGDIIFGNSSSGTAGGALSVTEKMRITSDGNVLIGATSNASGSPTFYVKNKNGAVANIGGWNFGGTSTADTANNNLLNSGAYYNGSSMVATQTTATGYQQYSGIHVWYTDSGLTPGNTYSNTERMRITSGGEVCIGMTSPIYSERLSVRQSSSANLTGFSIGYSGSVNQFRSMSIVSSNAMTFNNGVNEATLTAAGAWTNASDLRLKKDIKDIKYGLDTILNSKPRSYNRIDVEGEYIGFIAQELLDIIPEVVSGNIDTQYCVDYGSLVAVAFKAIQEQQAQIEELKELIKNK
jgi:hypothetical protein